MVLNAFSFCSFYLLCFCYQKDFNKEWRAVKNLIDRNYLKEETEIIPYISTKDYFQLEEGKDLYYKENIKELPLGFQQYFKNLYEEYQRISIISSLYNKQRIFFIAVQSHLKLKFSNIRVTVIA